ncbi:hypothetical protein FB45DRAFT_903981 [Roridomyces roridus]|uniref:DUF1682-domain-containing protein n=1 Tax=Roridomyces roridus TaxID=1738132 RepID=A0AAD7C4S6_9AGAR|nr:hypothetical protein FB45DRAFT_903981 [Roridomyces roridus]
MSVAKLLAAITPPPFVNEEYYDGLEYRWKIFVFRPALFKREAALLAVVLFYAAFFFYGSWRNTRKAKSWLGAHLPILNEQFSKPKFWIQDGYSDFVNFSTGRRNIASLHTIFAMKPRHDLLQYCFQLGRTFIDLHYRPQDDLQLDFKLSPDALAHDFVWAVVSKDELRWVKDNRWDLTFTKTSEHSGVASKFSVMSEFADVTDGVLKAYPLAKLLENPKIAPYFRSLSITDQPRERPAKPLLPKEREKHVILSLSVPSPSDASVTAEIVAACFPFIDSLSKIALRPETKAKLKKMRDETEKDLKKEAEKEKREEEAEALEAKKALKRKTEEERIAKLSAAEQKKALERERKRSMRKQQSKLAK